MALLSMQASRLYYFGDHGALKVPILGRLDPQGSGLRGMPKPQSPNPNAPGGQAGSIRCLMSRAPAISGLEFRAEG